MLWSASAPGQAWGPPAVGSCLLLWESLQGIAGADPYLPKFQECREGKRVGKEGVGLLRVKGPCTPAFFERPVCVSAHACFLYDYCPKEGNNPEGDYILLQTPLNAWAEHLTDNSAAAQAFFHEKPLCVKIYSCVVFGTKRCFQTPLITDSFTAIAWFDCRLISSNLVSSVIPLLLFMALFMRFDMAL